MSILFKVWELSDIDHDGMLDRDEFAVVSKSNVLKILMVFSSENFPVISLKLLV